MKEEGTSTIMFLSDLHGIFFLPTGATPISEAGFQAANLPACIQPHSPQPQVNLSQAGLRLLSATDAYQIPHFNITARNRVGRNELSLPSAQSHGRATL